MKFELLRRKINHMATDSGYNMEQYLILAAYNTVENLDSIFLQD